jgi:hypothetical protein
MNANREGGQDFLVRQNQRMYRCCNADYPQPVICDWYTIVHSATTAMGMGYLVSTSFIVYMVQAYRYDIYSINFIANEFGPC